MSATGAWRYGLPPDDPARRVYWVVPLAALLVLLFMLGLARLLRMHAPPTQPPPPVQAEFYELPAVKGPLPAPGRQHAVPAPPLAPAAKSAPAQREAPARARVRLPHPAVRAERPRSAASPTPASPAQPPQHLDLSRLGEDVAAAVTSTLRESEYQRVRDPNSMVAHYYLASVLRKLERVGEMSYLGTMVGEVTVMIVIGPDGALDNVQVWRSSGDATLDDYAQRIVRMSAPFAPFSADLERETMQLKLRVNMLFEGYREVDAR